MHLSDRLTIDFVDIALFDFLCTYVAHQFGQWLVLFSNCGALYFWH